jgi:hypothetical protein
MGLNAIEVSKEKIYSKITNKMRYKVSQLLKLIFLQNGILARYLV